MSRREEPVRPGPLHQFATDLRALRAATGLTYRALARKAGFSYSTLSAAARGDTLPTLDVTLAYVGACGGDTPSWEQRWQALAAAQSEPTPTGPDNSGAAGDAPAVLIEPEPDIRTEPMDTPEPSPDADIPSATRLRPTRTTVIPPAARLWPTRTTVIPPVRGRVLARSLLAAAILVVGVAAVLVAVLGVPRSRPAPSQSLPARPAGSATLPGSAPQSSSGTGPSSTAGGHGPGNAPATAAGPTPPPARGPALVGTGSRGPGSNGAGGSGAGASGSGGGQAPVPGQQPALAWTATSGPSCVSGNATAMQVSGSWKQLAGSATAGCANALTHKETNDSNTADWILAPGVGRTCTFRAFIPNSSAVTSTSATYKGWDTAPGRHDPVDRLGEVRTNQQAGRGGWMLVGTFGPTRTGTIDLQLYDDDSAETVEVADMITATCT